MDALLQRYAYLYFFFFFMLRKLSYSFYSLGILKRLHRILFLAYDITQNLNEDETNLLSDKKLIMLHERKLLECLEFG